MDDWLGLDPAPSAGGDDWLGLDTPDTTTPAPEESGGGALSYGQDLVAAFGMGSNQLLSTLGNMYGLATGDMDNWARNQGESGVQYYKDLMSDDYVQSTEEKNRRLAEADGIVEEFALGAWETIKDPRFLAEQIPMLVAPGGASAAVGRGLVGTLGKTAAQKAAVGAGVGTGAALQGSDIGGQTYEELMGLAPMLGYGEPDADQDQLEFFTAIKQMSNQNGEVDFRKFLRMLRVLVDKDQPLSSMNEGGSSSQTLRAAAAARQKAILEGSKY